MIQSSRIALFVMLMLANEYSGFWQSEDGGNGVITLHHFSPFIVKQSSSVRYRANITVKPKLTQFRYHSILIDFFRLPFN